MSEMIKDGTGSGSLAKVDSNHRLYAFSTVESELDYAVVNGDGYNINTGIITLTNATETPVLYVKNNEINDLHIDTMVVAFGTSTGGTATENCLITMLRNPTAGTIVSGATAVDIKSNRNFGSTQVLLADAYKGATGLTLTDGTDHIYSYQSDFSRQVFSLNEHLPTSSSMGVKITPPTGNTSLPLYVAIVCHLDEE